VRIVKCFVKVTVLALTLGVTMENLKSVIG
jgi:hypothetical protein